jgi:uncharacterized protein (TIGR03437 family)
MKKILSLWLPLAAAAALSAQSVETIPLRARLSPANEVPPVNSTASGNVTVWLHVVRDAQGQIVSGSADFELKFNAPTADIVLTAMHIHSGPAGVNGPVVIDSGVPRTELPQGVTFLSPQGQIRPDNQAALTALRDVVRNPGAFYVNAHSTSFPGGIIRGQLEPTVSKVHVTRLLPQNEVPPVTGVDAAGTVIIRTTASISPNGTVTSAEVAFRLAFAGYTDGTNLTGFHIHRGGRRENGPVVVDSGLRGPIAIGAGQGSFTFRNEIDMANAVQVATVNDLLIDDTEPFYVNLHTQANPGGSIRGQLREPAVSTFQVSMNPSQEVPPITGLDASALAAFTVYSLRNNAGQIEAAAAAFDVNFRFPGETFFTGLHIHDGLAGVNGGVSIDSTITGAARVESASGFGNIYRLVPLNTAAAIAASNSITATPERHYLNLHTTVNAGGAVRGQVAGAAPPAPVILDIISAVSDPALRRSAPLGLITIFGQNLVRVPSDLGGIDTRVPPTINGVRVNVGDRPAAILQLGSTPGAVPPDYVLAQVPAETAPGNAPVTVTTPYGTSGTFNVPIVARAPAVFFDSEGVLAFKSNGSLVRADNPALPGEVLIIAATGLGQTLPPLGTGELGGLNAVPNVTVTMAGRDVPTLGALTFANTAGLYLVSAAVPQGLSGRVPLIVRAGGESSNTTTLTVR